MDATAIQSREDVTLSSTSTGQSQCGFPFAVQMGTELQPTDPTAGNPIGDTYWKKAHYVTYFLVYLALTK